MHISLSCSRYLEHITVLKARALAQLVSVIGWPACGHATRVLMLSDSLAVILASTKRRSWCRGMCRAHRIPLGSVNASGISMARLNAPLSVFLMLRVWACFLAK